MRGLGLPGLTWKSWRALRKRWLLAKALT